ncbi:hypothetical protein [Bacillus sp. 165]|nr:hypothetical protein [Bacillus sp. 165]MBO9128909.1 hypothetical protein [Bacillus sp. 165]
MEKKQDIENDHSIYTKERIANIEDNQQIEKQDTDEITHLISHMSNMGQ